MSKIAIKSTVKLSFPPAYTGFVEMEIDLIQNKPSEKLYELRIVDSCYDFVEETVFLPVPRKETAQDGESEIQDFVERKVTRKKIFGTNVRFKTYTYAEISTLALSLNLNRSEYETETEFINDLFRHGLLLTTRLECQQNLSGEGKGMYFSVPEVWEIVKGE